MARSPRQKRTYLARGRLQEHLGGGKRQRRRETPRTGLHREVLQAFSDVGRQRDRRPPRFMRRGDAQRTFLANLARSYPLRGVLDSKNGDQGSTEFMQ